MTVQNQTHFDLTPAWTNHEVPDIHDIVGKSAVCAVDSNGIVFRLQIVEVQSIETEDPEKLPYKEDDKDSEE